MREIQPVRHEGGGGAGAVLVHEQLVDPPGIGLAGADVHETAHDVAHHVVQETVGAKVAHEEIAPAADARLAQFLFR